MATTTAMPSSPLCEPMGFIIFTDLDGTLLDHDTYRWDAATPALTRIRAEGWPLVLVTSKTRAEVEPLRRELGLTDPFVVENGGGVYLPDTAPWSNVGERDALRGLRVLVLGRNYEDIRDFVTSEGHRHGMRGFGDMDVSEIAQRTGLSHEAAKLAGARDFTEPFVLDEHASLSALGAAAERAGLRITTGGRFHHLMGEGQDKGRAVRRLVDAWRSGGATATVSVALGDGQNDVPMLEAADVAILIPAEDRPLPGVSRPDARVASARGPEGWNAALTELFQEK